MTPVPEQELPENQDEDFKFRTDEVTGQKHPLVDGPIRGMDDWGGGEVSNSSTVRNDEPADVDEDAGEKGSASTEAQESTTSMDDVGGGSVPTSSSVKSDLPEPEEDEGGFAGPLAADAKPAKKTASRKPAKD